MAKTTKVLKKKKQKVPEIRGEELRVRVSKISPFTGVAFPEGSKRIAFEAYCQSNRNYVRTRNLIKNNKLFEGRVPSLRTMRQWAEDNHWAVLADMVDDGIFELLDLEHDPDIKDVIKDDEMFYKMMLRFRSQLVVMAAKKGSTLLPRNSTDFVRWMKMLEETISSYGVRFEGARKRAEAKPNSPKDAPNNVHEMATYLNDQKVPVTKSSVARALIQKRSPRGAD